MCSYNKEVDADYWSEKCSSSHSSPNVSGGDTSPESVRERIRRSPSSHSDLEAELPNEDFIPDRNTERRNSGKRDIHVSRSKQEDMIQVDTVCSSPLDPSHEYPGHYQSPVDPRSPSSFKDQSSSGLNNSLTFKGESQARPSSSENYQEDRSPPNVPHHHSRRKNVFSEQHPYTPIRSSPESSRNSNSEEKGSPRISWINDFQQILGSSRCKSNIGNGMISCEM